MSGAVAVVDDDPALRDSVEALLRSVGLQTAGYRSAQEFLDRQGQAQAGCLVLDVRLPGLSGIDLLELLLARGEVVPAVVVSGYADVPLVVRAIKAGALDFLEKPFKSQQLLDRVHQALEQGERLRKVQAGRREYEGRLALLTARELEVMGLLAAGLSSNAIIAELGIGSATLDVHRARVFHKMGVGNVAGLVAQVWEFGRPGDLPDRERNAKGRPPQPKAEDAAGGRRTTRSRSGRGAGRGRRIGNDHR